MNKRNRHVEVKLAQWDGVDRVGHDMWMLQQWRGLYAGHRVFVIGTGPSLLKVDGSLLSMLSDEHTFGANLILRCDLPFIPTMLGVMISEWHWVHDKGIPWMLEELQATRKALPPVRFYAHERPIDELGRMGWQYVRQNQGKMTEDGKIEGTGEYLRRIGFGHSVIISIVQIAAWLGFDPIYLLGCDGTGAGHAYQETPELDKRGDQGGFHRSAAEAEKAMRAAGRSLCDLTEGGTLPVTKGNLGDVLANPCPCGYRG